MHLKPSCWQGLLEALRDSDTRGLLQEHGQRIPLPRGVCGVMASHASDGYPSPPARALGGPGVHRRRAASPGGRTPVGPQPRDGGGVGPTPPGPWAQRLAAPGWWAAGHRAPSGRMGATAARRGASAPSGGLADRHLVGARSRGVGQTHVQEHPLPRDRAAVSAPAGVPAPAAAAALRQGQSGGPTRLRPRVGTPRAPAGAGERDRRYGPRATLAGCPAASGLVCVRPAGLGRLDCAPHARHAALLGRRGTAPGAGHHQAPFMVPAGDDGSVPSDAPPWPAGQTPRSGHGQGAASSGRDRGASPRASASDRPSMTT